MASKIFIVDQSSLIKHKLDEQLKNDFELRSASYADTALLEIMEWQPDLIISGVEIGNITGFDLCVLLKMIPKFASKPFIILSSKAPEGLSEKTNEVGADLYLEKKPAALVGIKDKILALLPTGQDPIHTDIKTLLVDDSSIIRHMMTNMLKGIGIQHVEHARNGAEALNILKKEKFDLLITDYHMPEMDGPALINAVRQKWSGKILPIIVATAMEDSKVGHEFRNVDIQAKLTKPISVHHLRETIVRIGLLK